jgi:uncharacterized protein YuzE
MNISYDQQADAIYIRFQEDKIHDTLKIQDGIVIDINKEGSLLGIEILDVSKRMPLKSLEHIGVDLPLEKHGILKAA